MRTITIKVSESVYEEFRQYARKTDRKASELIREAMELYRQQHMQPRTSLRDRRPATGERGRADSVDHGRGRYSGEHAR